MCRRRLGTSSRKAAGYARAEKAPATRRAYRSDFELFRSWCMTKRLAAEANRGAKPSTIGRRLAAIRHAHKLTGHEPPTNSEAVKATLRGIRRTAGTPLSTTADKVVAMERHRVTAEACRLHSCDVSKAHKETIIIFFRGRKMAAVICTPAPWHSLISPTPFCLLAP